jgi:hypothetical protein
MNIMWNIYYSLGASFAYTHAIAGEKLPVISQYGFAVFYDY